MRTRTKAGKLGHTTFKVIVPGSSDIYINPAAFEEDLKLFLVTGHELIHASHISDGSYLDWLERYPQNEKLARYISEYNAYQ